jgi:UDP-glucose 4-epimerase
MTGCIRKPAKRILVTGGSGFVGGYVLRHLRSCGYDVTNFDCADDKQDNCLFIRGSILDFDAVQRAVNQSDIVFHFAGFSNINLVKANPRSCIELNIMGTTNVLEAIRKKGTGKLVFASSVYVHDNYGHFYTTSKRASELICENYRDLYGLPIAILRLGTVYGEKSRHEDVVSIFSQKAVNDGSISIHGSGKQIRHFIHGEDVAAACEKLIAAYDLNGTFVISAKRGISIRELAGIVTKYIPTAKIEQLEGKGREDDYMGDLGAGLLLEETYNKLQWEPKIDIDEGVKRMIEYFK